MAYGVATNNPFDLLGDDDDPVQVAAAAPVDAKKVEAKKPVKAEEKSGSKPAADAAPAAAKGSREGKGGKGKGGGRGGGYYNREDAQDGEMTGYQGRGGKGGKGGKGARGKGYGGGGGGGDGEERRAPKRDHDRRSGTGRGNEVKRQGAGRGNWGSENELISADKPAEEKADGEEATAEKPEGEEAEAPKEEEDNEMTLVEYEKAQEQKRLDFKNQFKAGTKDTKVDEAAFAEMAIVTKPAEEDQILQVGAKAAKAKKEVKKTEKETVAVETNFHIPREETFSPRKGGKGDGRKGGKGQSGFGAGRGPRGGGRGGGKAYQAPDLSNESAFPTLGGK